jgi:hypothetical protein
MFTRKYYLLLMTDIIEQEMAATVGDRIFCVLLIYVTVILSSVL